MEKKYVENFLDFLQNDKKLSDNTLQSYNRDIKLYCNYLDQKDMDMVKTDEADIKTYLDAHNIKYDSTAKKDDLLKLIPSDGD